MHLKNERWALNEGCPTRSERREAGVEFGDFDGAIDCHFQLIFSGDEDLIDAAVANWDVNG